MLILTAFMVVLWSSYAHWTILFNSDGRVRRVTRVDFVKLYWTMFPLAVGLFLSLECR